MGRHGDVADRQQGPRVPEQSVSVRVPRHLLRESRGGGIGASLPDERHHGKVECRHRLDPHGHPARLGNPARHLETGIQRPVRIDLDHHLQAGLHYGARHANVGGTVQGGLRVGQSGRNGRGLAGNVECVCFCPACEKSRPRGRDASIGALPRDREHAQERILAGYERDRVLRRLDGLDQVRGGTLHGRVAERHAETPCDGRIGERRFRRDTQLRASRLEPPEVDKIGKDRGQRSGESGIVRQVQPLEGAHAADLGRDRSRQPVVAEPQFLQTLEVPQLGGDPSGQFVLPQVELAGQTREVAQFAGNRAGQVVAVQAQIRKGPQGAELRRDCPGQFVESKVEKPDRGQVRQFPRDLTLEPVVVHPDDFHGGQIAEFSRNPTRKHVLADAQVPERRQAAQFRRYGSLQPVVMQIQIRQSRKGTQLGGDRSAEQIRFQMDLLQGVDVPQVARYRPIEPVVGEIEQTQGGETCKLGRHPAPQVVPVERQFDNRSRPVRRHAVPVPQRSVGQPVVPSPPFLSTRRVVQHLENLALGRWRTSLIRPLPHGNPGQPLPERYGTGNA